MNPRGRTVIVVADDGYAAIVPLSEAITRRGLVPVLLTGEGPATDLPRWRSLYAEVRLLADPYDVDAIVSEAQQVAARRQVVGLLSCYDGLVVPAAKAAASLGLPHPTVAGLARARNKYAMRAATRQAGLPTPRFALMTTPEDAPAIADTVGFPAVAKPVNGTAGHLVRRVANRNDLLDFYATVRSRLTLSFPGNYSRPLDGDDGGAVDPRTAVLVEQCMTGSEYSAEVLIRDGVTEHVLLLDKFLVDQDTYFEQGFTWPPLELPDDRKRQMWDLIDGTVRVLGLDHAAAHVELMDTPDGPRIIEVNAGRPGGQLIGLLCRQATGIDMIDEVLALAIDQEAGPRPLSTGTQRLTSFSIYANGTGRLTGVRGLRTLARLPQVTHVVPFARAGDVLPNSDHEFFAVNVLMTGGCDRRDLESFYRMACDAVQFELAPVMSSE